MKEEIKNRNFRLLGYIETKSNGDRVATNTYGKILGYYRKGTNTTTDFMGGIIAIGDVCSYLVFNER